MSAICPVYSNHYQTFYTSKTSLPPGLEHFTSSRVRLWDLGFRNTEGTLLRPEGRWKHFTADKATSQKRSLTVGVFYWRYFTVVRNSFKSHCLQAPKVQTLILHQSQPLKADRKHGRQCTLSTKKIKARSRNHCYRRKTVILYAFKTVSSCTTRLYFWSDQFWAIFSVNHQIYAPAPFKRKYTIICIILERSLPVHRCTILAKRNAHD